MPTLDFEFIDREFVLSHLDEFAVYLSCSVLGDPTEIQLLRLDKLIAFGNLSRILIQYGKVTGVLIAKNAQLALAISGKIWIAVQMVRTKI